MAVQPVTIRQFRASDLPALIDLFRDTVHRVNTRDYTPEQVRAWAPDAVNHDRWATLAERFTVVADVEGQVAGFADLRPAELWSAGGLMVLAVVFGIIPRPLLDVIEPAAQTIVDLVGR